MSKAARLLQLIVDKMEVHSEVCTVDSVNGSHCDATPVSGGASFKKVRLNTDISSDNGIVITPKKDSMVVVSCLTKTDAWVSLFSEIESVSIKIGQSKVLIKDGLIEMNGGNLGGLVKVDALVKKLNALELAMDTHIHSGGTVSGMTGTANPPKFPNKTMNNELENTKVKHG